MGTEYFLSTFLGRNVDKFFLFGGRGRVLLCPRRQSNQNAAGAAFGEHLRGAGAHRRLAPDPLFLRGYPTVSLAHSSGGQSVVGLFLLASGPLGPGYAKFGGKVR